MKKLVIGFLSVAAALFAADFAMAEKCKAANGAATCTDTGCKVCGPCEELNCDDPCGPCVFGGCGPKKSLFYYGGHVEAGLYVNEYGRTNSYTPGGRGPDWNSGNTELMQNVHNSDLQMNQMYFYFGKKLDTRRGWDFGGHIDFMYGTDARFVQAQGMEFGAGHGRWNSGDYYTALPQMYFEAGYKNVSVKFGKFLTPLGHEGVLSGDRFFYSLSDAFGMNPVTHTGALVDWKVNRQLSIFGGWVNGENKFFDSSDDNAFLGGVKYQIHPRYSIGYSLLAGTEDLGWGDRDYYVHSVVFDANLGRRWDYTFEWTLRNNTWKGPGWKAYGGAYGINNELIYKLNKKWDLGLRVEWARSIDDDTDKYGFTLGASWKPNKWLTVRPEIRYDKFDNSVYYPEKGGRLRDKQFAGGISTIVSF